VSAGGRTAEVPLGLQKALAPLLAARTFPAPPVLADYGLAHPQATIAYQPVGQAAPLVVAIGATNFDRTGLYAQRLGDARVYLVLAGAVRPALALVGVDIAPPSG
jgi:hypothetical protein